MTVGEHSDHLSGSHRPAYMLFVQLQIGN